MAKAETTRNVAPAAQKSETTRDIIPRGQKIESPLPNGKPYRVLIADDHAVVRSGIRLLLASQPGIEVCGEAANGTDALALAKREKPDLVVLDLTMPLMNGLEVVRDVRATLPETEVLVLTMHFTEDVAREVLRCGALAYVLKSDADSDLLAAVDHVRHHQPFFTTRLTMTMAETFMRDPGEPAAEGEGEEAEVPAAAESPLTARELEVVQLLAAGKSNKEVATALDVSTRTVESHRNHVMHKMNFPSFSDLVRFAVRNKLVEP